MQIRRMKTTKLKSTQIYQLMITKKTNVVIIILIIMQIIVMVQHHRMIVQVHRQMRFKEIMMMMNKMKH